MDWRIVGISYGQPTFAWLSSTSVSCPTRVSPACYINAICSASSHVLTQVAINSRQADNASPQLHLVESMVVALMWMVAALTCRCRPLEKSAHLIVCTSFLLLGAAQASEAPFVATATMVPSDGDPSTRMTHFGGSGVEATTPFRERRICAMHLHTLAWRDV